MATEISRKVPMPQTVKIGEPQVSLVYISPLSVLSFEGSDGHKIYIYIYMHNHDGSLSPYGVMRSGISSNRCSGPPARIPCIVPTTSFGYSPSQTKPANNHNLV